MSEHRRFTADATNYLCNLDRVALNARYVAVHYQKPPVKTDRGTSIGLRFPMLIVAGYLEAPDEVAAKVADILERHWDDGEHETGLSPRELADQRAELLAALEGVMPILGLAESNASGDPEWGHVGPRVAAVRAAIAKAKGQPS